MLARGFKLSALSGLLLVFLLFIIILYTGCSALYPKKLNIDQRLGQFDFSAAPIKQPVSIYWNDYAVPYINAENEADLAFALGLVHAHLRLGQMEFFKRVVYGRISEMAGPYTKDIDHTLRILNLSQAKNQQEQNLPPRTKEWLEKFVEGINFYQSSTNSAPPEFGLLGIEFETWTVADVLALSRLAGADVSWFSFFSLLDERLQNPDFSKYWKNILSVAENNTASFSDKPQTSTLQSLLFNYGRHGSNSLVISGKNSKSGAPLVANDPHLGFSLPNFWLIVGVNSPDLNCVGLMIPGTPIFGIGRNQQLAWGGTNMRAASSELIALNPETVKAASSRPEQIRQRYWLSDTVQVRQSKHGPIVSDSALIKTRPGETLAIKWVGHSASDEISAFLKAASASSVDEFKSAFETFAVSAQNILFAHKDGDIGHILAAWLPERTHFYAEDLVVPENNIVSNWKRLNTSKSLPSIIKSDGFLASANNRPVDSDKSISFRFSSSDRIERLFTLLSQFDQFDVDALKSIQTDAYSDSAVKLNALLLHFSKTLAVPSPKQSEYLKVLTKWDGLYSSNSKGALYFELLIGQLAKSLYADKNGKVDRKYTSWDFLKENLVNDLKAKTDGKELFLMALMNSLELSKKMG